MKIVAEIERDSLAWQELTLALTDPDARLVRIGDDDGLFKIKVNEYGWTRALNTTKKEKK